MNTNNYNKAVLSQFLNERIRFSKILLIDQGGKNVGITSKQDALFIAKELNLDLFCITPQANPPVCRILDFSKYFYQLKKKDSGKTSGKKNFLKEAKFSFRIGDNDANIKIKKILKWLSDDFTVKIVLFMRGRERQHNDLALEKCNKIIVEIQNASPQFQMKDSVKLVGNMYNFTFFKSKKVVKNEKDQI